MSLLMSRVFGVSEAGLDVFLEILDERGATADELAGALDVNRTTVTRQANHLVDLGFVERTERSLREGGRTYVYVPVPGEEIRRRHREAFLAWVSATLDEIEAVDRRRLLAASERHEPRWADAGSEADGSDGADVPGVSDGPGGPDDPDAAR